MFGPEHGKFKKNWFMTTFFKKIRRKLISGKGLRSYLTYAIGEIVLVVAGILIALSINNWNESRQKQKEFESILLAVKHSLESDLEMMEEVKKAVSYTHLTLPTTPYV